MTEPTPLRSGAVTVRSVNGVGAVTLATTGAVTGGKSLTVQTSPEPLSARVRRLQAEARVAAAEHVEQLRASLAETARLAAEIADGGEAYPVGAREMARRLMEDAASMAMSLDAINTRPRT